MITRQDFAEMRDTYTEKVSELRLFASELEKVVERYRKDGTERTTLDALVERYMGGSHLTREMVEAFLSSMTLYEDGHVEVSFACQSDFDHIAYEALSRQKEGV
jgi:glucose-6-phosphate isomerase